MKENFNNEVIATDANLERNSNRIATDNTQVFNEQPENPCTYMGVMSLEPYIFELYMNYLRNAKMGHKNENIVRTIENAIWEYDDNYSIENGIEVFNEMAKEQYMHPLSEKDMFLIRLISLTRVRHSMDFYLEKLAELMEKYSFEIRHEKALEILKVYVKLNANRRDEIEHEGWVSYNLNEPQSSCPYKDEDEQMIWNIGWELNRIETIWRNAVN